MFVFNVPSEGSKVCLTRDALEDFAIIWVEDLGLLVLRAQAALSLEGLLLHRVLTVDGVLSIHVDSFECCS